MMFAAFFQRLEVVLGQADEVERLCKLGDLADRTLRLRKAPLWAERFWEREKKNKNNNNNNLGIILPGQILGNLSEERTAR